MRSRSAKLMMSTPMNLPLPQSKLVGQDATFWRLTFAPRSEYRFRLLSCRKSRRHRGTRTLKLVAKALALEIKRRAGASHSHEKPRPN